MHSDRDFTYTYTLYVITYVHWTEAILVKNCLKLCCALSFINPLACMPDNLRHRFCKTFQLHQT